MAEYRNLKEIREAASSAESAAQWVRGQRLIIQACSQGMLTAKVLCATAERFREIWNQADSANRQLDILRKKFPLVTIPPAKRSLPGFAHESHGRKISAILKLDATREKKMKDGVFALWMYASRRPIAIAQMARVIIDLIHHCAPDDQPTRIELAVIAIAASIGGDDAPIVDGTREAFQERGDRWRKKADLVRVHTKGVTDSPLGLVVGGPDTRFATEEELAAAMRAIKETGGKVTKTAAYVFGDGSLRLLVTGFPGDEARREREAGSRRGPTPAAPPRRRRRPTAR